MRRITVRRWYQEPALVEAVFEMRPEDTSNTTTTLDTQAMQTMRSRLRGFSARGERLQIHAPVSRYGVAPGEHEANDDDGAYRACTWNHDDNRAVQFGGGILAFNVMAPYGHYEDHQPSLRRVIQTYLEAAKLEAGGHCLQRYLNVFPLQRSDRPDELFSFYPPLPTALIQTHVAISLRIEAVQFRNGFCTVRLWRHELDDTRVVYRMEVLARSKRPVEADTEALLEWHQLAHAAVNRAYDMSITEACRKRLREL